MCLLLSVFVYNLKSKYIHFIVMNLSKKFIFEKGFLLKILLRYVEQAEINF
jgi:hypothetical protein